jgi:uncharacterized protein (DUF488 family)
MGSDVRPRLFWAQYSRKSRMIGIVAFPSSRYPLQAAWKSGRLGSVRQTIMQQKESLFTLGYSGYDPTSFLERLRRYEVKVVIDVRRKPVSRKKGFSRSSLSQFLAANDIEYRHEFDLGVPDELRSQLKSGKEGLADYFEDFQTYLADHVDALERVYAIATERRCCLLCLEHFPEDCHRSIVAKAVEARNGHRLQVMHV